MISQLEVHPRSSLYVYNVKDKVWCRKADMTQSRACLTAVTCGMHSVKYIFEINRAHISISL